VLFIKRKKVLVNGVICPTGSVKYTGAILDAKLTWREDMKRRISKAYFHFGCALALYEHSKTYAELCGNCVVAESWSGHGRG
jgi:hypothetical protein